MSRQKSGKSKILNIIILVLVLAVVVMSILPLFPSHTASNEAYGCGCGGGGAYPLPDPEPTKATHSDEGYQSDGKKGGKCKRVIAIPSVDSIPQLVHSPITVPWRRLCRKCE